MYPHVFIMVRFTATSFTAYIARERSSTTMHPHMLRQIVTPMERFATIGYFAYVFLRHLVFSHVPLTVVFPNELASAVVARVRTHGFVRVHVRYKFRLSYERALALSAFERFSRPVHVHPSVQLQIPFGRERFVANDALERSLAAVSHHVSFQCTP